MRGHTIIKRCSCLLLTMLLLILCGCSGSAVILSNEKYTILEKDGVYAMKLHDAKSYTGNDDTLQNASPAFYVEFSSVGEMKETIESGTFSDHTLRKIQQNFSKDKNNHVLLCNTSQLYVPTLPGDVKASSIFWYGETYNFMLSTGGRLIPTDKAGYDEQAKRYDIESGKATVISVSIIADRNAKEVIYENLLGERCRILTYSCTDGSKTITVAEEYNLEKSQTVPYGIGFWGKCDGAYFKGYMYELTERPSFEWVTAFGLKPYVETETE